MYESCMSPCTRITEQDVNEAQNVVRVDFTSVGRNPVLLAGDGCHVWNKSVYCFETCLSRKDKQCEYHEENNE